VFFFKCNLCTATARLSADEWVKHNSDWVRREMVDPADYWKEMAKYRFQLAPPGAGVQAPKFAEVG
jgi:hypothetical protein